MRLLAILTGLLVVAATGCASVVHKPLLVENDGNDWGIRYYGSSPSLIAYSNGKGGVITEIKYFRIRTS